MNNIEKGMERLFASEGLHDLDRLLSVREWDEVPIASRRHALAFLDSLEVKEQSRILVIEATRHLDRLAARAERLGHPCVVLVSIYGWSDLDASPPECVIPRFWISTKPESDLANFRLTIGASPQAALLNEWLASDGLLQTHEVLETEAGEEDPDLHRVYVGQRGSSQVEAYRLR